MRELPLKLVIRLWDTYLVSGCRIRGVCVCGCVGVGRGEWVIVCGCVGVCGCGCVGECSSRTACLC